MKPTLVSARAARPSRCILLRHIQRPRFSFKGRGGSVNNIHGYFFEVHFDSRACWRVGGSSALILGWCGGGGGRAGFSSAAKAERPARGARGR